MTAGALAVHHLRYLVAPAAVSHEASDAHAYLTVLAPLVLAAVLLIGVHLVSVVLRASMGHEVPLRTTSFRRAWLTATAVLLGVFVAPELAEGLLFEGHPEAAELFRHGGLAVFPIASAVGAVVALSLRGANAVIAG